MLAQNSIGTFTGSKAKNWYQSYLNNQNQSQLTDSSSSTNALARLRGLPFYHWNKSKEEQQGSFVGTVGLPVKRGLTHGLYDYEQQIIEYLETDRPNNPKNKHLYILKSSGLGITTLLLYYIGYKCTVNNDWSGSRVCILTAPRLELTIDLVDRLKGIFSKNGLAEFDTKNTICNINNVKIEAFPSHLGLKAMRGLTDIKMIVCDEASFFDMSQVSEVRDTLERYIAKSDPAIVYCSTPNRPDDLMDLIRREQEDKCIYHRIYLDYKYGLDKIYTEQEIELQRLSPSFLREYCLSFTGLQGNVFSQVDIDRAVERGKTVNLEQPNPYSPKCLSVDPGFGSSQFAILVTQWNNNQIEVIYASQFSRIDFNAALNRVLALLKRYNISKRTSGKVYIDAANPEFLRAIKFQCNERPDYENEIAFYKKNSPSYDWTIDMFCIGINFSVEHKNMLAHCKKIIERPNGIAIPPQFEELITSLRTAVSKEYSLVKEQSLNNDLLDALRMNLTYYR